MERQCRLTVLWVSDWERNLVPIAVEVFFGGRFEWAFDPAGPRPERLLDELGHVDGLSEREANAFGPALAELGATVLLAGRKSEVLLAGALPAGAQGGEVVA